MLNVNNSRGLEASDCFLKVIWSLLHAQYREILLAISLRISLPMYLWESHFSHNPKYRSLSDHMSKSNIAILTFIKHNFIMLCKSKISKIIISRKYFFFFYKLFETKIEHIKMMIYWASHETLLQASDGIKINTKLSYIN